jgi:asparagine synthase (glutamine-hydrolysing)
VLASKFVKVALTGTGGDDLFAGYPWWYYRAVADEDLEVWNRLVQAA